MKGMTSIVRNMAGLIVAFVVLYGLYIVASGHTSPGGGFAGGVIIMTGAILLVLAFGGEATKELTTEWRCQVVSGIGALIFVLVGLAGLAYGGFFVNFLHAPGGDQCHGLLCGGTILVSDFAICVMVAAGLIGIFLALILGCRAAMFRSK